MSGFTTIPDLNLPDVGALVQHFEKQCVEATYKNVKIVLQQLADPKSFFKVSAKSSILDQIKNGGGVLAFLGSEEFMDRYADDAALALVQATGAENIIKETLNTAYKWVSLAFMLNNNIVFILMKTVAVNIIAQLERKMEREKVLREKLVTLHNALKMLSDGDPIYNEYLDTLRQAASLLGQAKSKVQVVRGTLRTSNIYLSKQYSEAQKLVAQAQTKIRPSTGGNPFTTPFYDPKRGGVAGGDPVYALRLAGGNLLQAGSDGYIPGTKEQTDNILAIPLLTRDVIKAMRDYTVLTASINGMLRVFVGGIDQIATSIFTQLKQTALDLLSLVIKDLANLKDSMDDTLKPLPNGRPKNPVQVTAQAFKWTVQVSSIISEMKLLPEDALKKLKVQLGDAAVYQNAVDALKRMDTVSSGKAVLEAKDAQEQVGNFERQLLTGLLQANAAVLDNTVGSKALPLITTLIARCDLSTTRDTQIKSVLQTYVDHKFEGEDEFNRIIQSINSLLANAGMDRALDLWKTGDYAKFFGMNPKTASYVGAALEAVALLKECFKTTRERDSFDAVQKDLEREKDLLNIKIDFDFESAIRFNLKTCTEGFAKMKGINIQSILCGLATQAAAGSIFDPLSDSVAIPE